MATTSPGQPGAHREPDEAGDRPAIRELRDLLAPLSPEAFFRDYWARRPLHLRGRPDKFAGLFDRQRFDAAIERGQRSGAPGFRVSALFESRPDEPLTLASTERIEPGEVDDYLAEGYTICVNNIGAGDPGLAAFARAIKSQMMFVGELRFNCFLSPDDSGADTHLDGRMPTTLQIDGRKRWRFSSRPAIAWPLSNAQVGHDGTPVWMQPWAGAEEWERLEERVDEAAFEEVILEPGDLLCLPAGAWHNAKAIGHSLALNLAFSPGGTLALFQKILEAAFLRDAAWRGSPPPAASDAVPLDGVPDEVRTYLADRLADLRTLVADLDPADPLVRDSWRGLAKR